ncbi:MAG: hypothetical protein H7645_12030 [Candidatus Heimdallarchaeota archaeon]|nr:hypothetical protein [Candidatus Heimdallarchaeota archaeon]MCK4771052.1 hypothetical protein [Candidatus Heimdallarchaeota archaeon]
MKHKKLIFGLILIGLVGFAWLPAVQTATTDATVVDFVIWLMEPERQVLADEMIEKTESLGLVVNTIYVDTIDDWALYAHETLDYDLIYGPFMTLPKEMDIFFIAYIEYILSFVILSDDNKIYKNADKLLDMWMQANWYNPDLFNDEDFINDMVDLFNDNEERYWEKQYESIFVQFETETSEEWEVPSMRTDALNYNCLPGRVFHNTDLRLQLNSIIDRTVFLDYYALYTSYSVYEVHHLYQFSPFHDATLPNNYNF